MTSNNLSKKRTFYLKTLFSFSLILMLIICLFPVAEGKVSASEKIVNSPKVTIDSYMFGSSIDKVAKTIYNELLVKGTKISTDKINVSVYDHKIASDDIQSMSKSIQQALDAISRDFVFYEWIYLSSDGKRSTTTEMYLDSTYIKSLVVTPAISPYHGSTTKVKSVLDMTNDKVNEILLSMPKTANTRYKRIEYIHDYLVDNVTYDTNAARANDTNSSTRIDQWGYAWEAYGAYLKKYCVCEGYAKAFKLALDKLDIPCQLVSGNANGSHMWNQVQMEDGKWYLVDVTFDDPIYNFSPTKEQRDKDKDTYFLIGSDTLSKAPVPHTAISNYINYKSIAKNDYDPTNQVEEPLVIYKGYLQERYLNDKAETLVDEREKTQTEEVTKKPAISVKNKTIKKNKKFTLKVKNLESNAKVTYKISNKKIAKVTKNGKVTGIKKGTATITTTVKQNGKTYTFKTKLKVK